MSIRKTFFYLSIFLLISSLLLIIANNVPILASFRWFWAPIFLLFSLLYIKKINSKYLLYVLFYGLLYCLILQYTLWRYANDWYKKYIREDYYSLAVFYIMFLWLYKNKFINEWIKLAALALLFFFITGIMTIIATKIEPEVVRASYSSGYLKIPKYDKLYKLGFGSYGYMTALISLIPILIFFIKTKQKTFLSNLYLYIFIFLIIFLLIRSQIFANIIIGISIFIFSFLSQKRFIFNLLIYLIIILTLLNIPKNFWINSLLQIRSNFKPKTTLYYKFTDIVNFLEKPDLEEPKTSVGGRAERYPMLFKAFKSSPFFGDASYDSEFDYELGVGYHLYWMSRLTLWGIYGFLFYIFFLVNIFKPILSLFDNTFKYYYKLSLFSIIALGLMKNLAGREPYIMLFVVIPGLYFNHITKIHKNNIKAFNTYESTKT